MFGKHCRKKLEKGMFRIHEVGYRECRVHPFSCVIGKGLSGKDDTIIILTFRSLSSTLDL